MFKAPHLQTVWGPKFRRLPRVLRTEEKFYFSDGDHCWLHWAGPKPSLVGELVVLLHGLAGSSESQYIVGIQSTLTKLGLASVAVNFRGAGGRPNNLAKTYHSGEATDLAEIFRGLVRRWPHVVLFPVGYSLGGSRLLNFLSEKFDPSIGAAVAVCVPMDLAACEHRMNQGFSQVYRNHLIGELTKALIAKVSHLERVAPAEARKIKSLGDLSSITTFREYDDRVIASLFGYMNADDYYQRCSVRPKLRSISNSTLIIQAYDDPFMTPAVIPELAELSGSTELEVRNGGHVGFVDGLPLRPTYWLEQRIPEYLKRCMEL